MNTYRRVAIVITALLLAGFAVGQDEASTGMCLMYRAISPDKEEDWTSAGGVEAQLRFWQDESVAVALALGVDRWKAVHEFSDGIDELGYYAVDIDGTATLVPIGVSPKKTTGRPVRAKISSSPPVLNISIFFKARSQLWLSYVRSWNTRDLPLAGVRTLGTPSKASISVLSIRV